MPKASPEFTALSPVEAKAVLAAHLDQVQTTIESCLTKGSTSLTPTENDALSKTTSEIFDLVTATCNPSTHHHSIISGLVYLPDRRSSISRTELTERVPEERKPGYKSVVCGQEDRFSHHWEINGQPRSAIITRTELFGMPASVSMVIQNMGQTKTFRLP